MCVFVAKFVTFQFFFCALCDDETTIHRFLYGYVCHDDDVACVLCGVSLLDLIRRFLFVFLFSLGNMRAHLSSNFRTPDFRFVFAPIAPCFYRDCDVSNDAFWGFRLLHSLYFFHFYFFSSFLS
jgi:hypothetical protein